MLRGHCALDLVEELRVRQWARRNWVPLNLRDQRWHHIILDEMTQRDRELEEATTGCVVPLMDPAPRLSGPHYLRPQFSDIDDVTSDASTEMHFG